MATTQGTVQLVAEFEGNRTATVAALEAADEEIFARSLRSAGGVTGSSAVVLNQIAVVDVLGHARDITRTGGS
jgi:hypothetical protein